MRRLTNRFISIAIIHLFLACDLAGEKAELSDYNPFISWDNADQFCNFDWQCEPSKDGEERYCIPFNANPDQISYHREMRKACMKPREKYEYCKNDNHCLGHNACIQEVCQ